MLQLTFNEYKEYRKKNATIAVSALMSDKDMFAGAYAVYAGANSDCFINEEINVMCKPYIIDVEAHKCGALVCKSYTNEEKMKEFGQVIIAVLGDGWKVLVTNGNGTNVTVTDCPKEIKQMLKDSLK